MIIKLAHFPWLSIVAVMTLLPVSISQAAGETTTAAPRNYTQVAEVAVLDGASNSFNLLPGYQVERLFTVPKETLGSWVNITTDARGRLIVSDEANLGLCRITPTPIGTQEVTKVEHLNIEYEGLQMSGAQGLLWAFNSLFVVRNGHPHGGLFRCTDTDGDDQFDKVEKLKDIPDRGENGPHAIRLSPDGQSLFISCGNHTTLPFEIDSNATPQAMGGPRTEQLRRTLQPGLTSRLMPNWDEDLLLPRQWDGGGHAAGIHAPGGWICKIDPEGKTWDVFSSGYRNQFDFAFNADGEMFVYDADMEWDFGSPWYRPTRVVHATSGSEFGWRNGTGKWPSYYVDSLPPVIDIGPGCPVGVEFGYGTKFPGKYQKSLFVCDWTFGTMYAIHIEPSGSSYQATKEEFLSRTPLPLTDCTVGKDGALYFTTGGRGSQSELFRITYMGTESTSPVDARDTVAKSGSSKVAPMTMRAERQDLERYHVGVHDPKRASEAALSSLGSSDRHLSTAARVALERIPVAVWQDAIFTAADLLDTAPNEQHRSGYCNQVIHGCVGLARQADPDALPQILTALGKLDLVKLNEQQQLGVLRAYQLALIRLGEVDGVTFGQLSAKFDRLFPSEHALVNRELAILMIFFRSPNIQAKLIPILQRDSVQSETNFGHLLERNTRYGAAIAAMLLNQPDQNQYHYAFHLRTLKTNWTMADRQIYFSWFDKARKWSGGASYPKFLANIDDEAFALLSDADRLKLESNGSRKPYLAAELPKAIGPGRDYALNELVAVATEKLQNRDFKNGKKMFGAARCVVCHRFGHEGGATGPDLTQLAGRFTLKDLTEAIVDPSKVISDQFKAVIVETKKGMSYTGKMVRDSKESITLVIDPEIATKVLEIHKSDIAEQQVSLVSLMPKDLLKTLNQDEVLDLLAYLLSRGDAKNAMFHK